MCEYVCGCALDDQKETKKMKERKQQQKQKQEQKSQSQNQMWMYMLSVQRFSLSLSSSLSVIFFLRCFASSILVLFHLCVYSLFRCCCCRHCSLLIYLCFISRCCLILSNNRRIIIRKRTSTLRERLREVDSNHVKWIYVVYTKLWLWKKRCISFQKK